MEYFTFKGKSSATLGVLMSDEWVYAKAAQRYDTTEIDGRDGAILTPTGFSLVERDVDCTLLNRKRLNDVMAWLNGSGTLEFEGRYRKAYIYDEIDYTNLGVNRSSFSIPFIMEPFWYREDGYALYENGSSVENNGNYDAVPLLQITGKGDGTVTLGGVTIQVYDLEESETLEIDCLEMSENLPARVGIGFEYPRLAPGKNEVKITGDLTLKVKRKDRWIG